MVLALLIVGLFVVLAAGIFTSLWIQTSKGRQEEPKVEPEETLPKIK